MSKVKPLLPGPVAAARRVLRECDVRHPRDIHVESIAARCGAIVLYGPVTTASATMVRNARHAVIWADESVRGGPRADFTNAHELGHHWLHAVVDHFARCGGEDAEPRASDDRDAWRRRFAVEREANHFATELLMPEQWAAPMCRAASPTLDDVDRVQRAFRTSFRASAIRYVELAAAPCAFVQSRRGTIVRSTETESFPGRIVRGRALHPRSVAAALQSERAGRGGDAREVPSEAWGHEGGAGFVEHAIALGPAIGVLSWVVPLAVPTLVVK